MSSSPEPVPDDGDIEDGARIGDDAPLPPSVRAERRPVRFDGLRLNGFKSFPEATEIRFEPGLTGIVGPNGCGKSNLLEGLRWAMGETSARRMRGASMDDMIFNGTEERPPRNVADVTIFLSGGQPGAAGDDGAIEITRRIERGQGTRYRINGQDALQRTVQILFQDNAVGSSSAAIVSQGRVSALILAKPSERRGVLEDAAGVAGLNARRQEYSRRIAGIQENIGKADGELAGSGAVLTTLRRQARQAQRHREIGQRVREALAMTLHLRHAAAVSSETAARGLHEANEALVMQGMLAVASASREREEAGALLGPAREARLHAEGRVARAEARIAGLAREIERIAQTLSAARLRVIEATADGRRLDTEIAESEERARGYREERVTLAAERAEEGDAIEAASEAVEVARGALAQADARQEAAARALAEAEAVRRSAERAHADATRRVETADRRLAITTAALTAAVERDVAPEALAEAEAASAEAGEASEAAAETASASEEAVVGARQSEIGSDEAHDAAASVVIRLTAERRGLLDVRVAAPSASPVIERLGVRPGYEAAVAAALGASALAGTDPAEEAWWGGDGVTVSGGGPEETLAGVAGGVTELSGFLGSVSVIEEEREGLPPFGRAWVTLAGRLIRWDGFRRTGGEGGVRAALERTNRLRAIEGELSVAETVLAAAVVRRDACRAGTVAAREREARDRTAMRAAAEALRVSRDVLEGLRRRQADSGRLTAAARAENVAAETEKASAAASLAASATDLAGLVPDGKVRAELEAARAAVVTAREREASTRVAQNRIMAEAGTRKGRIDACVREEVVLAKRVAEARERRTDLVERLETARGVVEDTLQQQEAMSESGIAEARDEQAAALAAAEVAREAEAAGEDRRQRSEAAARDAEAAVGRLREERARLLAAVEASVREREAAVSDILAQLACEPGQALAAAALPEGAEAPDLATAAARLTRLERERDSLGEINFLAEQELQQKEGEFGELERRRTEMRETLLQLGRALRVIEDEARGRLRQAFDEIDGHFGRLFARLFNGGMAHLRMVGSEDPLEAGLEVYASPPGKRMQILSLFSGGEQALTAMALVFAAFLANPAPVCICDEIDAALDDVNVDSLVSLMETMAQGDSTRFLCITHRPLMMARMARLYGVTMMERGVTSVTRVDLDRAMEIAPRPQDAEKAD